MPEEPQNLPKAVTMARLWWRVIGFTLLAVGGLWFAFGSVFEVLGGVSLAIAGLAAIVLSFAKSGDVAANSARETIQIVIDHE